MKPSNIRLRSKDQLALFTDLSTMLSAGIPILETIESLEPDAKGNLKKILAELRRSLTNGETLSRGMARFPKAFEPVTINLMRAAESGGTLEETLQDIVATTKKNMAFGSNLKNAMIYPAFVMGIFTGIIVLMLTFVIPRISAVFSNLHVKTPLATRILMHASVFLRDHWLPIIFTIVIVVVLFVLFVRSHKRAIARAVLGIPGLRHLGITIDLARMTRSFALLLKAGVPLDEILMLTKRMVNKKEIIGVIEGMQRNLNAGKPLATGLREAKGIIPVMMARSMETAETTGTLDATMQSLAEHFDAQVDENLKTISSLLEPLMILIVGGMVGLLMLTVMAPIYKMVSQFRPSSY